MAEKQRKKLLPREELDEIAARDGFPVFLRRLEGLNYIFLYANTSDEQSPDKLNKTYDARTGKPHREEYHPKKGFMHYKGRGTVGA